MSSLMTGELLERLAELDAYEALKYPPAIAWSGQRRERIGPPVIELSGACGILAFYKAAGCLALRKYANPVLSIGASGGTIPTAFLQTGADDDVVFPALKGLPAQSFAELPENTSHHMRANSSSGAALTDWLDGWLTYLGHETWASYRYEQRPAGLASWSHRFNIAVTVVEVPAAEYDRALEGGKALSLTGFVRLLLRLTRRSPLVFRELILPRDIQPGPNQQLPWLYETFDEQRVAQWMTHSMRAPGAFVPHIERGPSDTTYVFVDGALLRRLPTPFHARLVPPLPVVAFEVLEGGRQHAKHTLISMGRFPGVNPLDFESATPEVGAYMYAAGAVRASNVYPHDLYEYFQRYREIAESMESEERDPGSYRLAVSAAGVLRTNMQPLLAGIRRH